MTADTSDTNTIKGKQWWSKIYTYCQLQEIIIYQF